MKRHVSLMYVLFTVVTSAALAQGNTSCPSIVQAALENVDEICSPTSRNQVCYGNFSLDAEARAEAESVEFESVGDIANVVDIESLSVQPMNVETDEWGVAVMKLQANLPDTLPGQNVTFLLFGDVQVTNAVTEEQLESGEFTPMQAFYFTTGIGDAQCKEAPDSGLLVQTPEGIGEVNFVVNEVNVTMGSTILFRAEAADTMTVSALEGAAVLEYDDAVFPVIAGTWVRLQIDNRLRPISRPTEPDTYEEEKVGVLPLQLLERNIVAREPMTQEELEIIRERLRSGEPLCGEDPFPACDHLPVSAGGLPCLLPQVAERAGNPLNRPLCELPELFERPQRRATEQP